MLLMSPADPYGSLQVLLFKINARRLRLVPTIQISRADFDLQ